MGDRAGMGRMGCEAEKKANLVSSSVTLVALVASDSRSDDQTDIKSSSSSPLEKSDAASSLSTFEALSDRRETWVSQAKGCV